MPLVGGIVYGDKYPYILPASLWIAVILLLIGAYLLSRKYYAFASYMGLSYFWLCFVLGWALVSLQLKQADHAFPNTEKSSAYQVVLTAKPEIKKNSICFMPF